MNDAIKDELYRVALSCASAEEMRVLVAAKKVDEGQDPVVVDLPQYVGPTIHPIKSVHPDMIAFKVTLEPTGRTVRYTVPRIVLDAWKQKCQSLLIDLGKKLVDSPLTESG